MMVTRAVYQRHYNCCLFFNILSMIMYLLKQGFIGSSAGPNFARICPKLVPPSTTATNTAALDADLLTDTNLNCANKGTFVFLTTGA